VNGRQNKDADDDVETRTGKRQLTLVVRNVTDKCVAPRRFVVAMFLVNTHQSEVITLMHVHTCILTASWTLAFLIFQTYAKGMLLKTENSVSQVIHYYLWHVLQVCNCPVLHTENHHIAKTNVKLQNPGFSRLLRRPSSQKMERIYSYKPEA